MKFSDFLDKFTGVERDGDAWRVVCPAHPDSDPSLRVAISSQGKLLLRCRTGCETKDVLKSLDMSWRDFFAVELPDGDVPTVSATVAGPAVGDIAALATYVQHCAERLQTDGEGAREALAYLSRRFGVTKTLAEHLRLGVDPGGTAEPFTYRTHPFRRVPRLTVPFLDPTPPHVARGLQGRALADDDVRWCGMSNPDGAAWSKIAVFDLGTGLDYVLITEGPGDGLTAAAAGYDAVAVRGAALASSAALAADLASYLRDRRVVVCGDSDAAGQLFSSRLAGVLHDAGLQVSILSPPTGKDLSEWREDDPDLFKARLDAAVRAAPLVGDAGSDSPASPARRRVDAAGREGGYARTDLGNAERLRDHLERLVRYSPEVGFFLWDGSIWSQDKYGAVRAAAQEVTRRIVAEGESIGGDDGNAIKAWGLRSQDSRRMEAMVRELSVMPGVAVDVERMDAHPDLLTVRNGILNLRSGALMPHDPALLLSRKVDVEFDADATAPTWDYFLSSIFPGKPDLVGFMRRLAGYGITGHTSEQCFAVLWGKGANGKSVFVDTLTHVFRAVTVTTPFSTFEAKPSGGIPNDLASLKGARLVMASEGEQGKPMAEAVIKRVTGADLISARFMRKEFFEFRPSFLIFLATNFKPNFRGQDEGLWRRVKLIPFDRYFAPHERDHYLADKLRAEAQGILAWAVRGATEWYRDGLGDPPTVVDATREYRETSDSLAGFFPGRLVADPDAHIVGSEAYHAYLEWLADEGMERDRWSRKAFYAAMEERGALKARHASGQVLKGVRRAKPGETVEADEVASRAGSPITPHVPGDQQKAPSLHDLEETQ